MVGTIRQVRPAINEGEPDLTLTPSAGLLLVGETVDTVDLVGRLDDRIGAIKQRNRGVTGGQLADLALDHLVAFGLATVDGGEVTVRPAARRFAVAVADHRTRPDAPDHTSHARDGDDGDLENGTRPAHRCRWTETSDDHPDDPDRRHAR